MSMKIKNEIGEIYMHLTSREMDKLLIVVAADVARRRKNKGLKLNYPESVALILMNY